MRFVFLFLATMLAGCVTTKYQAVPAGYSGPTAWILDTVQDAETSILSGGGTSQAAFFVVTKIDGQEISQTLNTTANLYAGRGPSFVASAEGRKVPIREMTLELLGQTHFAAPIFALIGDHYSAQGRVTFTPEAGKTYLVKGKLGPGGNEVWLEDFQGNRIGDKIASN